MGKKYVLSFDGACEPQNPGGIATCGHIIVVDGQPQRSSKKVVGEGAGMTNNVAEYAGLIEGLASVSRMMEQGDELEIRSDSQLVVRQMTGAYRVKSARIRPLHRIATRLIRELRTKQIQVKLKWVPREDNKEADALTHEAFVEYCQKMQYEYHPCGCGGTLVPRTNKQTGHKFLGCSRFPRCGNTTSFPANETAPS